MRSQAELVNCRTLRWNGDNVDVKQRLRLPQQTSGRHDELEELAAILSAEAGARRSTLTIVRDERDDLAPAIVVRRPTHRGRRVAVAAVLGLSAVVVGMLTNTVLRSTHAPTTPTTRPAAAVTSIAPNSPATWGVAARQRLSAGGRPVSVFGCMGAYDVDAPLSSGMLPIAYQGTPEYGEYMSACVSDMSGQAATPNELAR